MSGYRNGCAANMGVAVNLIKAGSKYRSIDTDIRADNGILINAAFADDAFDVRHYAPEPSSIHSKDDYPPMTDDICIQMELPLETPAQIIKHHRDMIRKYQLSQERMAMFALRWYYLMEDVDDDEQIAKLFNDLQFYRKLIGGTVF
jgi:hypothetical protein